MNLEQEIKEISVRELKEKIDNKEKFFLLDVRTYGEKQIADIGGELIPVQEIHERYLELKGYEDSEVIVYCHHGMRSFHACQFLRDKGFKKLFNLSGGIDQWSLMDASIPRY